MQPADEAPVKAAWSAPPDNPTLVADSTQNLAAMAGKNSAKPAPKKLIKAEQTPQGNYWIQVASRRKRGDAERIVKTIIDKNSDLIGSHSFAIVKAKIRNAGTFYRSRVGPFASFANARKVCKDLKSRRQDCLVIIR
jgi:cell division protein FtsN